VLIEGRFQVDAPPQELISHLLDAGLMASCVPGCESLEAQPDGQYRAVVAVALAGIKARFNLRVQITGRDERSVSTLTRGEEDGNASSLSARTEVSLQPEGAGTLVSYRSELSVTGRLGRFGLGMLKKKAQVMGEEFALELRQRLQQAPSAAVAPSAPVLRSMRPMPWLKRLWQALVGWLRGLRRSVSTH
jgi:carbon monoxide dehydrogenase subunit G